MKFSRAVTRVSIETIGGFVFPHYTKYIKDGMSIIYLSVTCVNFKSMYSKTCVKRLFKNRQNIDFNDKWSLNEG